MKESNGAVPQLPDMGHHAVFLRTLKRTAEEIDGFVAREPAYPVWRQLQQQLHALQEWTADGAEPKPEQWRRISIGLIAARELEPTADLAMEDLTARLHELNYYARLCGNPKSMEPPPLQPSPIGLGKAARLLLIAIAGMAIVWLIGAVILRGPEPPATSVGPSLRAGDQLVTLIAAHRPGEASHVSLVLSATNGNSTGRKLTVAKDVVGDMRLLGYDERFVWFFAGGIGAIDLKTRALIGAADLRRVNPELAALPLVDNSDNPLISPAARHPKEERAADMWADSRRYSFGKRLRVRTPDYQREFEIDPATLRAIQAR